MSKLIKNQRSRKLNFQGSVGDQGRRKEGGRKAEIKPRGAMIPRYVRIKKLPAKHKRSYVSEGRAGQLGGSSRGSRAAGSREQDRLLRPWQSMRQPRPWARVARVS